MNKNGTFLFFGKLTPFFFWSKNWRGKAKFLEVHFWDFLRPTVKAIKLRLPRLQHALFVSWLLCGVQRRGPALQVGLTEEQRCSRAEEDAGRWGGPAHPEESLQRLGFEQLIRRNKLEHERRKGEKISIFSSSCPFFLLCLEMKLI